LENDLEIDKQKSNTSGIQMEKVQGEYSPPPVEAEETFGTPVGDVPAPGQVDFKPRSNKIALQPGFIRLIFRVPGELAAWRTGWPGWRPSEEDLNDIVNVYDALGIETSPWLQALVLPTVMYAEKWSGYIAWKSSGSPNSTKEEFIGTKVAPERGV